MALIARAAAVVACLLLAGVAWIEPTAAYRIVSGSRAVSATIVTEGNGYSAPIVSACSAGLDPTTCSITIYDNATTSQTYTVTKLADASNAVTTFDVDGHAQAGNVATGNAVAIGGTSVVTMTIRSCTLPCITNANTFWMIQGASPSGNVLTSREENVRLVVQGL